MSNISIIVPVYKVEPYIHRCVDSILAQTFTDFELILVDDGSPDNCGAICEEYKEKDDRVVVIHQENGGLSAARNAGIDWVFANSNSEWLTFIDSDDWVHPKYMEALYNAVNENDVNISICGFERTEGNDPVVDVNQLDSVLWNTEDFFVQHNVNAIVAWGKLYRKEYFESIRYPIGKLHEDEFTTYKILFKDQTVAVIDQPLYAYYQNTNGIMGRKWDPKRLDRVSAFYERIIFFKELKKSTSLFQFVVSQYIWDLYYQLIAININDYKRLYQIYLKQLRRALRKYKKYFPVAKEDQIYWLAFPKEMRIRNYQNVVQMKCREMGFWNTVRYYIKKKFSKKKDL